MRRPIAGGPLEWIQENCKTVSQMVQRPVEIQRRSSVPAVEGRMVFHGRRGASRYFSLLLSTVSNCWLLIGFWKTPVRPSSA